MNLIRCYLCGRENAQHDLNLSDSFTSHSSARCPSSQKLCDQCHHCIQGDERQLWYWNPNKKPKPDWSQIWGRSLTRLYQGDKLISPNIALSSDLKHSPEVKNLATRKEIRQWLVNPLEPPFKIVIAESGQKHILFLSLTAYNKNYFPIQFELDTVWIQHSEFCEQLNTFEKLLQLGFNKTEVYTGEYPSHKLINCILEWELLENQIKHCRKTRQFDLLNYIAQKPELLET